MPESYAQYSRRHRRDQIRRAGAREGIDALVSALMLRLPVDDPGDLLDAADRIKRGYEPVVGGWE